MVARVAIFEGINVEAAQSSMDEAEAIIRPMVEGLQGYQGVRELASADGRFISITFFDTEENARAAEPVVRPGDAASARAHLRDVGGHPHLRRHLPGGGRRPAVDEPPCVEPLPRG